MLKPKSRGPMSDEHVSLFKGTRVEEEVQPLARRKLATGMLLGYARLATAETGPRFHGTEFGNTWIDRSCVGIFRWN